MNNFLQVLHNIRLKPEYLQSNFSRYNARRIAEAASRGFITSVVCGESYNRWFITNSGLEFLKMMGYDE